MVGVGLGLGIFNQIEGGAKVDAYEWDRQFKVLVKAFNLFTLDYNEGIVNREKWRKFVEAVDDMVPPKPCAGK